MHYYKFNIGDYASHTQHLEPLEDIAYRRMLDWVYLHESPLPDCIEQIGRLIRMRTHSDCIANVLREFFTLTDYGWMQEKASEEIDAFKEKSSKAKASAAARWSKDRNKPDANAKRPESERNANHKPLTTNHKPITINQIKEVLSHLNIVAGRKFTSGNEIKARLNDYTVNCLKLVIDYKTREWKGTSMEKYLRPQTLFGKSKFEGYLNDARANLPTGKQSNADRTFNNLINAKLPDLGSNHGQPDTIQTINGGAVIGLPESNDTGNDSNVLDGTWQPQS